MNRYSVRSPTAQTQLYQAQPSHPFSLTGCHPDTRDVACRDFKSPASCLSLQRSTVPSEMTVTVVLSLIVQSLSHVRLFETPWTIACQAPLSSTIS